MKEVAIKYGAFLPLPKELEDSYKDPEDFITETFHELDMDFEQYFVGLTPSAAVLNHSRLTRNHRALGTAERAYAITEVCRVILATLKPYGDEVVIRGWKTGPHGITVEVDDAPKVAHRATVTISIDELDSDIGEQMEGLEVIPPAEVCSPDGTFLSIVPMLDRLVDGFNSGMIHFPINGSVDDYTEMLCYSDTRQWGDDDEPTETSMELFMDYYVGPALIRLISQYIGWVPAKGLAYSEMVKLKGEDKLAIQLKPE